jgi:two-component system sensor histidine kinase AlgZ
MRQRLRIPNFKNLGVILRTLLLVNAFLLVFAFAQARAFSEFFSLVLQYSSVTQPVLFLSIALIYFAMPSLGKMTYGFAALLSYCITLASALLIWTTFENLFWLIDSPALLKVLTLTSLIFFSIFYYFFLLNKAYAPAIQEARIQALQARIQPHFLFNSINTVLSLIRQQPRQAETALEDMADLFRVLMADNRDLVPISREISLSKQYLALEKLRLEERLAVDWQVAEDCNNVLIPPLILQPLLENAVYHGIEPLTEGGKVRVEIMKTMAYLHIIVSNPRPPLQTQQHGNKMALTNIKERLLLHFDLEAKLETKLTEKLYQVQIVIPLTSRINDE